FRRDPWPRREWSTTGCPCGARAGCGLRRPRPLPTLRARAGSAGERRGRGSARSGSSLDNRGRGPPPPEVGDEVVEEPVVLRPPEEEDRRSVALQGVEVRGDEHLVVASEDRVVHRRAVVPELDAWDPEQRLEMVEGRPDPVPKGTSESFLGVAFGDVAGLGVRQRDPDAAPGVGLLD